MPLCFPPRPTEGHFYGSPGSGEYPVLPFIHLTDIVEHAWHKGHPQNKIDMAPDQDRPVLIPAQRWRLPQCQFCLLPSQDPTFTCIHTQAYTLIIHMCTHTHTETHSHPSTHVYTQIHPYLAAPCLNTTVFLSNHLSSSFAIP